MKKRLPLFCMAVLLFLTFGCGDSPEPVTYTEPVPEKSPAITGHGPDDGHNHPVPEKQISWTLPSGWTETKSSGMSLARITVPETSDTSITLTRLGGTGISMTANIQRWAGQLGLDRLSETELNAVQHSFDHKEAKTTLVDFNSLTSLKGTSMKVCVLEYADFTLYLKLTGPEETVSSLSDQFLSLAQSISYK